MFGINGVSITIKCVGSVTFNVIMGRYDISILKGRDVQEQDEANRLTRNVTRLHISDQRSSHLLNCPVGFYVTFFCLSGSPIKYIKNICHQVFGDTTAFISVVVCLQFGRKCFLHFGSMAQNSLSCLQTTHHRYVNFTRQAE